jgi:cyclopropane-fatty-acyl-phospholipid synthase
MPLFPWACSNVGASDYAMLGRVIDRTLSKNGQGLRIHRPRSAGAAQPWIRKRIFPGADAPTLPEVFNRVLEPHVLGAGRSCNLRWHYAKTLEHWRHRFDDASRQVLAMFDETFVRAWRLYADWLAGIVFDRFAAAVPVVFARGDTAAGRSAV